MKLFLDDGGSGKGAPLVLVHGLGTDSTVWSAQLAHLRKSRRVLAPDLRGHGKSEHASEYTVQLCVDDLQETLPVLGEKVWLAGHSFSGSIVSRLAGQHPGQLAGVIFVDAVGDVTGAPPEAMAEFRKQHEGLDAAKLQVLGRQMLAERSKPDTIRRVLALLAKMDPKAFGQLRESMAENPARELLAKFHGPKFAIDDRDGGPNPRSAGALPGVSKDTIPGVGHWLMLDDPEALNRAFDHIFAAAGGDQAAR
jgi:pimeloyl-ACP methyl ester carboxylesterase